MGIIKSQSIKGSMWSYFGVVLGFINLVVLSQRVFTSEQIGLTQVLVSFATILSQFGTLGMGNVAIRLFPHFRCGFNKHNGFIGLAILVSLVGFVVMSLITYTLEPLLVRSGGEASTLLVKNYFYIYPLIFFLLFFAIFDSYNRMLYDAVLGVFLREFLARVINTGLIVLFIFNKITFEGYVLLYVISLGIPTLILTLSLWYRNQLTIRFDFKFLSSGLRGEVFDVALFGVITGLSSIIVQNLDRLMVNKFIGLDASGIYGVTFFFGTLILISHRAISNISTTIIVESWKRDDLSTISEIYTKSSINQFIIGLLIFIGIWANIGNIFQILRPEYEAGKWVIFFISLSNLTIALSGVAMSILATSRFYRYILWFTALLIVLVVVSNIVFIPLWGLTGAAVASFFSMFVHTLITGLFVYQKFKIKPLTLNHIGVIAAGLASYWLSSLLPVFQNFILDIAIRSSIVVIIYTALIIVLRSSDDINSMAKQYFKLICRK